MSNEPAARTPGAKRAAPGEYVFDLGTVQKIMGGPAYSTAHGPCVEGDRMIVGLMRMKAGTGAEAHSHPNEQWIYVLEGTFHATIGGKEIDVTPGSVVYIPANTFHALRNDSDHDIVFLTIWPQPTAPGDNGMHDERIKAWGAAFRVKAGCQVQETAQGVFVTEPDRHWNPLLPLPQPARIG